MTPATHRYIRYGAPYYYYIYMRTRDIYMRTRAREVLFSSYPLLSNFEKPNIYPI